MKDEKRWPSSAGTNNASQNVAFVFLSCSLIRMYKTHLHLLQRLQPCLNGPVLCVHVEREELEVDERDVHWGGGDGQEAVQDRHNGLPKHPTACVWRILLNFLNFPLVSGAGSQCCDCLASCAKLGPNPVRRHNVSDVTPDCWDVRRHDSPLRALE